ncbi:MAG: glycoside hydrolase family 27 protein [Lentisphaeria bacterium]|nr:glycoside hydrolase family 27 protein [Lentisphaeria bacterium]
MKSLLENQVTVAPRLPFDQGVPHINGPAVFGLTPRKICFYVFPVRGEAPVTFRCEGALPSGIELSADGRLTGRTSEEGDHPLRIIAENRHGRCEKDFTLKVHPGMTGLSPLLGWSSWNAMDRWLNQEKVLKQAHFIKNLGLAARGYAYVNIDSGWQGGKRRLDTLALIPNERFPDMAAMVREIHSLGLKAGIYSTPMVIAWGSNPEELFRGSTDYPIDLSLWMQTDERGYAKGIGKNGNFGGIGKNGREKEDARQWAEWGFDYLKYDWPECDLVHVNRMKEALLATDRDFVYSLTTHCSPRLADEYKKAANMFRDNNDNLTCWDSIQATLRTSDAWLPHTEPGSWYDLDMLALGPVHPYAFKSAVTRDEMIFCFSAWTLLSSPVQLSCNFDDIDDFTLDLFSNEELLSVNQDVTGRTVLIRNEICCDNSGRTVREIRVYRKALADGSAAYGFFNFSETPQRYDFPLETERTVEDLWARRALGKTARLEMLLPTHGARVLKIK